MYDDHVVSCPLIYSLSRMSFPEILIVGCACIQYVWVRSVFCVCECMTVQETKQTVIPFKDIMFASC